MSGPEDIKGLDHGQGSKPRSLGDDSQPLAESHGQKSVGSIHASTAEAANVQAHRTASLWTYIVTTWLPV